MFIVKTWNKNHYKYQQALEGKRMTIIVKLNQQNDLNIISNYKFYQDEINDRGQVVRRFFYSDENVIKSFKQLYPSDVSYSLIYNNKHQLIGKE